MMPFHRKLIYLLILGIIPILALVGYFYLEEERVDLLHEQLSETYLVALKKTQEERLNKLVRKTYQFNTHNYIDSEIEKFSFCQKEIVNLQKALQHGFHTNEAQIKQRLQFLTNGENTLSFVEGPPKQYKRFRETIESSSRPVEVEEQDIVSLLAKIEGIPDGVQEDLSSTLKNRPDLIISECKIEKKKGAVFETYILNVKILRREYH